jgi:hypothetical protein
MNTGPQTTSVAPIVRLPGEGERFERPNRVVTIKVDLADVSIHEIEFDPTFEVPPWMLARYERPPAIRHPGHGPPTSRASGARTGMLKHQFRVEGFESNLGAHGAYVERGRLAARR